VAVLQDIEQAIPHIFLHNFFLNPQNGFPELFEEHYAARECSY
jgi:hypothetical protein